MKKLDNLFNPKSIAVVGASPVKGKLGRILMQNIAKSGWKGKLYPVNPKHAQTEKDYFSSLGEIKKAVDLVLVAVPAELVSRIAEQGAEAKPAIKNFLVYSAGFKETGEKGKDLEGNLAEIAEKYKLNILGPNCLGFSNFSGKLNATFTDMDLKKGNIAIVSQSGALAVALLDWADLNKIGFSKIFSIGNKAVLDESDILEYLSRDKDTSAVALYLEDIKNGPRFLDTLSKITPQKPVIILKAGKTAIGQKAVSSHTGSLAQDEEIVEAAMEKCNAIYVSDIEEFQNIIYYLNFNPVPQKNEVVILTNAGGPGVLASDFIGKSSTLRLKTLPDDFKDQLKKNLPQSASVQNPIDVIGDAPPERYRKTLEKLSENYPEFPLLAILTPQNQTDPTEVARIIAGKRRKTPHLSASFMGGRKIAGALEILAEKQIPNFPDPEKNLSVIEKLVKYNQQIQKKKVFFSPAKIQSPINLLIQKAQKENRKMLFWKETEKLFRKEKVALTSSISLQDMSELKNKKVSFPCVLKTDDPKIAHRWEKKAVTLNIQNQKELQKVFLKTKKCCLSRNYLIQPMMASGLELIFGMKYDPTFGPVILCGLGGTMTEVFRDKIILIPPFTGDEIREKLFRLKIAPILKGFRGEKAYNVNEIVRVIQAIGKISQDNPKIKGIDVNPAVFYNNGKPCQILDAKIYL
ncbi:MAG: acetate--CoA ligase family protein [Candidatus Moranbacteria bacterium]|nr:acetate--CoA ligase family protein [Candidatus Moranbacteria bacterium]